MILSAKHLVTGDGKTVIENGAVLIEGGIIREVGGKAELTAAHPADEVTDYGEATLLPGLIDMHVHMGFWYNRREKELYNNYVVAYLTLDYAQKALRTGVTTMRDVSGPDGVCEALLTAERKGFVKIPRVIHCNRALCATGGHAWDAGDSTIEADGETEIRKAVREQIRGGAEWIKVMASHRKPGISEYTQEELSAAVNETHRHLKKATVHCGLQPALEYCINAGFDCIEHGNHLTVEQAKRMTEKGMAFSPTLLVHHGCFKRLRALEEAGDYEKINSPQMETVRLYGFGNAEFRARFKQFVDMGLVIVSGTDQIGEDSPPAPVADELAVMNEYGMTVLQAIAAGTSNSAKVLGLEGQIGILAAGAKADILVAGGDASADITALKDVRAVWFGGELIR